MNNFVVKRILLSRLLGQCVIAIFMVVSLFLFWAFDSNTEVWIREAKNLTITTLKTTLLGFSVFLLVFSLLLGLLALAFYFVREDKQKLSIFIVVTFALIVAVNSVPMVIYLEIFRDHYTFSNSLKAAISLIGSNAMAYYFFHGFVSELWEESQKLYVVSATFRGKSVIGQLKERATWLLIGYLSPLFYYILSFSLFTDILLSPKGQGERGIVRELFIFLLQPDTAWSSQFWVYLITMLAIVMPIRILLDWWVVAWEKNKNL